LKWYLKWSDNLDFYDSLLTQGNVREEDYEPQIGVFEVYLEYFFELDTCRNGMSNGPISFTDIYNFANIIDIEDFDEFLYLMRKLDRIIIEHRDKKHGNTN